jgi:hypothetical protein
MGAGLRKKNASRNGTGTWFGSIGTDQAQAIVESRLQVIS